MMMEVNALLKRDLFLNPKRTNYSWTSGVSEEQGLNGSRAFVEDHPEMNGHNFRPLFNLWIMEQAELPRLCVRSGLCR